MPKERILVDTIRSWSPALDVRKEESKFFVIDGKNYYFDAEGPKSGFGSLRLTANGLGAGHLIQSFDLVYRHLVFGRTGIFELVDQDIGLRATKPAIKNWKRVHALESIPDWWFGLYSWSMAYLSAANIACHPWYGALKITENTLATFNPVGFPDRPLAVAETNGRLIVLNEKTVSWSGPADVTAFTPQLGGAGFQILAERVPGDPITVTAFPGGFVVWTDGGALLAEYIGGDLVWRWDRLEIDMLPMGMQSFEQLPDGRILMITAAGLMVSNANMKFEPLTPLFNEYWRKIMSQRPFSGARLDYIAEMDQLFLSTWDSSHVITETFVLAVNLDLWGKFSEPHYGICRFHQDRNLYGYFDSKGRAQLWTGAPYRENQALKKGSLNSYIDVGYFMPENFQPEADTILEVQEIDISVGPRINERVELTVEDFNGSGASANTYWTTDSDKRITLLMGAEAEVDEATDSPIMPVPSTDDGLIDEIAEEAESAANQVALLSAAVWEPRPEEFPLSDGESLPIDLDMNDGTMEEWGWDIRKMTGYFQPVGPQFGPPAGLGPVHGTNWIQNWDLQQEALPVETDPVGNWVVQNPDYGEDATGTPYATQDWKDIWLPSVFPIAKVRITEGWLNIVWPTAIPKIDWKEPYDSVDTKTIDWGYGTYYEPGAPVPLVGVYRLADDGFNLFAVSAAEMPAAPVLATWLPQEDWNDSFYDNLDLQGDYGLLMETSYNLTVLASPDGYMEKSFKVQPVRVEDNANNDLWVCMTAAHFHSLRISATRPWQKFHLRRLAVTIHYAGQSS